MIVNVPTKVIPIWFIEKWKKEEAEKGSALEYFIEHLIKSWEIEEIRQKMDENRRVNEDAPTVDVVERKKENG